MKFLWVLKDAVETGDALRHEPNRHQAEDYIACVECDSIIPIFKHRQNLVFLNTVLVKAVIISALTWIATVLMILK